MNDKLLLMLIIAVMLIATVGLILNIDVLTPKQEKILTQIGWYKTQFVEGVGQHSFTFRTEDRWRAYFNCTTDAVIFSGVVLTIDGREKYIRTCEGRRRLIALKDPGEYKVEINPLYKINIGSNQVTTWRLEIWEKSLK